MSAQLRRESRSSRNLTKANEVTSEGAGAGGGAEGTSEEPSASSELSDVKRRQKKDRERRFSAPPGSKRQHGERDSIGSYLSESQGVSISDAI